MNRPRDSRGRFVKKPVEPHRITEKEITRVINRIADGGEPSIDDVRKEYIIRDFIIRALVGIGAFILFLLVMWLLGGF